MSLPINDFKLGLFTFCGLAIAVAGILVFGARTYLEPTSKFETYIPGEVTGLAVGSAVELRGVYVGKVTRINFSWTEYKVTQPSYVLVEFEARDDVVPLPPGAAQKEILRSAIERGLRARVEARGITGTSILSLEYMKPTESPLIPVPWKPRHTYIPSAPGEFVELLASVQTTLHNVERLDFNAINHLVQDDLKLGGEVLRKAGQFDFAELSTNANCLVTHLHGSNAKLKVFLEDADDVVRKARLEKLGQDFDTLIGQLQDTVARVEPGLVNIDFNALNQTLAGMRRAVRDMDDVLARLKEYPSGFLFGKPPPPLTGVQPSGSR